MPVRLDSALAPAVTLTLASNPAGLDGRIGTAGGFAAAPISQSVPPNSMQTIGVTDKQVKNGIGYGFVNWTSTGAAVATQQATTTIQSPASATATANFQEVCYLVTTSVAGGTGGTVALSPVSGGLTGYPANCYPKYIELRVSAAASVDYGLRTVVISIGGVPQTVTDPVTFINVTGPVNITATFAPKPNPILSATQPVLQGGGSYTTTISFTNSTASAGTNLRIANLTFTQAGVTLTTPLPIVYGNLPANGSGGSMVVTYSIPASVLAGTTFFMNLTVEVTNVNGDVFISNPSFSQTKP